MSFEGKRMDTPEAAWYEFIKKMESRTGGKKPPFGFDDVGARALFLAGFVSGMDYLLEYIAETSTDYRLKTISDIQHMVNLVVEETNDSKNDM